MSGRALRLLRGKATGEATLAEIERLLADAAENLAPDQYRQLLAELLELVRREQARTRKPSRLASW